MSVFSNLRRVLISTLVCFSFSNSVQAAALQVEVYNPGQQALFPVSSSLIIGEHEVLLVDAQFGKSQAQHVVEKIRATGKPLRTIYISAGDPDFYFGLETILAAYPQARVYANAHTIAHIRATAEAKLKFWGPKLGADAPARTVLPELLPGDELKLEGERLQIIGAEEHHPQRSFVWLPSIKTVIGSIIVFNNQHVWMADTKSPEQRRAWLQTLAKIEQLQPQRIVPGHDLPGGVPGLQAAKFTADYIRAFDEEAGKAKDGTALIAAMQKRYPGLAAETSLQIGAKVVKGEMAW